MSDREDFLNSMSADNAPTDTPPADPVDPPEPNDPVEPVEPPEAAPAPAPAPADPMAGTKAFLDTLTNPDPNATPAAAPAAAPAENKDAPAADPAAPATPPAAKTPEQEEAELLDGVKSERGKERIREKLAELRETSAARKELEGDLTEFRTMVLEAYQDPQDFARALEFGRLVGAGDDASLRTALGMLDEQRAALALRLGVDAPGVDPLAEFPDLKQAVEDMAITREKAIELAKYKHRDKQQTQQRQAAQQQQQERQQSQQQHEQEITALTEKATAYFTTRSKEVDYPAKMDAIKAYFGKPENVQNFVQSFRPDQWLGQFQFMYDNIRTAPAPRPSAQNQPLRSRPAAMGAPAANPNASLSDRIASHLDSMGI